MSKSFAAYNIIWKVDMTEIFNKLDEMTCKDAAEALEIPKNTYANMTTDERHDYAYDYFHHRMGAAGDFMSLPTQIAIPEEFQITSTEDDMSAVTDWMSDSYGYYIDDYDVKEIA